ncbi:MAG TPA: phosphoribosylanthranilate isomerase [Actinomycetota bacterium]|nr:phosphoribosylanthranilate isomerase [Actinomycetota bacterium]
MGGTFVKICGITRLGDARAAVRAGANAVGFVFASSPRRVSPTQAANIAPHVHPALEKIGVFVDSSLDRVLEVVDRVGLSGVQLQGGESAGFISELKDAQPRLFVSKVIRMTDPQQIFLAKDLGADAIFVDRKDPKHLEAEVSPIPAEWLLDSGIEKLVVAGGLTPVTVGDLVSQVRPWGVDVSGGVESSPGKKDPALISRFVRSVREVDALV